MTKEVLKLPGTTLSTCTPCMTLSPGLESLMQTMSGSFKGGLHAIQHALIVISSLVIFCDRRGVGGVPVAGYPQTETNALLMYDGYRGGAGLARSRYDHIEGLSQHMWEPPAGCDCSDGRLACIQSPHCGRVNELLDKCPAATLMMALADPSQQAVDPTS